MNNTDTKRLLVAVLLTVIVLSCTEATADELGLGLWTYHFDRDSNNCVNEEHNLFQYKHRTGATLGMYKNSICKQSYFVGYSHDMMTSNHYNLGYEIALVSGYSKSMHQIDTLLVIPMVYAVHEFGTFKDFGIKLTYVPHLLVGVGFIHRW